MMIRWILGCLVFWAVWTNVAFSAEFPEPLIRATASKTNVLIAESFTVRVEVFATTGSRVEFPEVIDEGTSKLGVFDIISTQTVEDLPVYEVPTSEINSSEISNSEMTHRDEMIKKGQRRWVRTVSLETLRLGNQTIPAISAIVLYGDDQRTLTTQPIEITVRGVLENPKEPLRDIDGVIEPESLQNANPPSRTAWLAGGCLVIMVFLAVAVGFRWWKSRHQPLRRCRQELGELTDELARSGNAPNSIDWVNWGERLRSILSTAIRSQRDGTSTLPSTQQLVAEIKSIDASLSVVSSEPMLRELDRVRFSSYTGDLPSESLRANATGAVKEAVALLDRLSESSRSNRRGG